MKGQGKKAQQRNGASPEDTNAKRGKDKAEVHKTSSLSK